MSEELYQKIVNEQLHMTDKKFRSIHMQKWPEFNEKLIQEETVTVVVQVNGKVRSIISVDQKTAKSKELLIQTAKQDEKILKYLAGKEIKKEIVIIEKLVNFVVG
jgi:leucyl-tRNA synthetase